MYTDCPKIVPDPGSRPVTGNNIDICFSTHGISYHIFKSNQATLRLSRCNFGWHVFVLVLFFLPLANVMQGCKNYSHERLFATTKLPCLNTHTINNTKHSDKHVSVLEIRETINANPNTLQYYTNSKTNMLENNVLLSSQAVTFFPNYFISLYIISDIGVVTDVS